jgi:hypothetical protein
MKASVITFELDSKAFNLRVDAGTEALFSAQFPRHAFPFKPRQRQLLELIMSLVRAAHRKGLRDGARSRR